MEVESTKLNLADLLIAAGTMSQFSDFYPTECAIYIAELAKTYGLKDHQAMSFKYDGKAIVHVVREENGPVHTFEVYGSTTDGPIPHRLRFNYHHRTGDLIDIQRRVYTEGGKTTLDTKIWQ